MFRRTLAVILGALAMAAPAGAHMRVYLLASYAAQRAQTTTLITPQGQPVGGQWQRWLNESQVPTYRGTMILDVSTADDRRLCNWAGGLTGGCSNSYAITPPSSWTQDQVNATPETIVNPTDELTQGKPPQDPLLLQETLYYEQGHIVDMTSATDADRAQFMRIWRLRGTTANWWTGEAQYTVGGSQPPGEVWSAAYQVCAEGWGFDLQWIEGLQQRPLGRWALQAQRRSCGLFRRL